MEIWQVICESAEGTGTTVFFERFADIGESLRISYSTCIAVDIVKSPKPTGGPVFTVTGQFPGVDAPFKHIYRTMRFFVHDRATHL